jgi:hypothetical protein
VRVEDWEWDMQVEEAEHDGIDMRRRRHLE